MAHNPLGLVSRQLLSMQFRRSPEFDQAVAAAVKLAHEQTFCSPVDYARSRVGNGFAGARELTTWKAVHERLRNAGHAPADADGAASLPVIASAPAAEPAVEPAISADERTFAVRLTTEVGPGSPAARLSALADAALATVKVVMQGGEPILVYTLPSRLAAGDFSALSLQA